MRKGKGSSSGRSDRSGREAPTQRGCVPAIQPSHPALLWGLQSHCSLEPDEFEPCRFDRSSFVIGSRGSVHGRSEIRYPALPRKKNVRCRAAQTS
jgi:hypothetical protein